MTSRRLTAHEIGRTPSGNLQYRVKTRAWVDGAPFVTKVTVRRLKSGLHTFFEGSKVQHARPGVLRAHPSARRPQNKGTVKWYHEANGYGFIKMKNGQSAFVQWKQIQGKGFKSLKEGQKVLFDITRGPRGLTAKNVIAIESPANSQAR